MKPNSNESVTKSQPPQLNEFINKQRQLENSNAKESTNHDSKANKSGPVLFAMNDYFRFG